MILDLLSIPVCEHCNLNCKRCLHFCHLNQSPYFYPIDQFYKDLDRMKEFFVEIKIIRLYGGEPLLNLQLDLFIEYIGQVYPNTKIEIITNGIELKKMNNNLVNSILRNNVEIRWSVYPIFSNNNIIDTCSWLKAKNIKFRLSKVAFSGCSSLTSVTIGNNVKSIGEWAFYGCTALKTVYYKGTAADWGKISIGSQNSNITNTKRYYYSESKPTGSGNYWHYVDGKPTVWASDEEN